MMLDKHLWIVLILARETTAEVAELNRQTLSFVFWKEPPYENNFPYCPPQWPSSGKGGQL